MKTPRSLNDLCRRTLPSLIRAVDGQKMLDTASEVVQTDRWNSFDRFHETTETIVGKYQRAGAVAEVDTIQTGGQIGSGRWVIQEAQDVRTATVDVVKPVRLRLLDFKNNPWHVVQWTAGTPSGGAEVELVVIDDLDELQGLPAQALTGKMVLTNLNIRDIMELLADRGAVGVITDISVPNNPHALAWTKFGWGAVPMGHSSARLVGLVMSQNQGRRLRQLVRRYGNLRLHVNVQVRRYVGTHDVVSGIVRGADDPQDEVWAIAHSGEPGAVDNASGVAVTVEIARVMEQLIAAGAMRRPRRTIRLLNAYECYGFFAYLEQDKRFQPPLAGVCIDTVGHKPKYCGGRLEWHATIPMSAGFVDWIGYHILGAALRRCRVRYALSYEPFVSTSDTLIGDPKYGFPCPWITTHHQAPGVPFDAYHSSADQFGLLSAPGLQVCAASMAAYLYYLADLGSREVVQIASSETERLSAVLRRRSRPNPTETDYVRAAHDVSLDRLQRWLWGGRRSQIMAHFEQCRNRLGVAAKSDLRVDKRFRRGGYLPNAARMVPRRTALLTPSGDNVKDAQAPGIFDSGLEPWALFWADGKRDFADIARYIACERSGLLSPGSGTGSGDVDVKKVIAYFRAHEQLKYVTLARPQETVTKSHLMADLKALGVRAGMEVMVHSSLSAIGSVHGAADTVVDALLETVGRRGTVMMPSFNHGAASVYNAMTTPTTNGAIPDAFWRRPEAVRSQHPTHAVAAIGHRAEELCTDHLEAGIWEQDSPIGKLVHSGGYILAIGVTHSTTTAHHVAEMSVPSHCNDPFGNVYRVVNNAGGIEEVLGLAWRASTCPVSAGRLDGALDRRGVQNRGLLGQAQCALVPAYALWEVRRQHLRNACSSCRIRPGYTT